MDAFDDELEKVPLKARAARTTPQHGQLKPAAGGADEDWDDETEDLSAGGDPIQRLLTNRNPRVRLHRATLKLLQRVGGINGNFGVHDFCNEAIRYVILARESGTVCFTDLHAVSAAIDARLDELSVILLRLHETAADLTILLEQQRVIGAFGERLRAMAKKP